MTSETLKTWVGGDGLSHIKKKKTGGVKDE